MATILDELTVVLGLSSKGFDSAATSAQKKLEGIEGAGAKAADQTKKIGHESETAANSLGNLSGKMASFLALIGGSVAIKAFIKDTIETNTQLYFMSRNLDMSVQGLYALGAAAQEIGIGKGSLQQLAASLKQIPGQLLAGQTPTLLPLLARAGIRFDQSPQQIMAGLARYFATMPANIALGLGTSYGLSYDQMTFLLQGVQKVQAAFDRDKAFAPTTGQAAKFAAMKQQLVDIGLAFTKVGYDLLSKATPYIEKFLDMLMRFGAWAQQHEGIVSSMLVALAAGIGAVSVATLALGASLVGFNPVILGVVAGISALAGAITFLIQDYQAWAIGQKSVFDWELFSKLVRGAGDAFDYLGTKIDQAGKLWEKFQQTRLWKKIDAGADTLVHAMFGSLVNTTSDFTRRIGQGIAQQEGFNKAGSIPNRANNPGDIEWGEFARRHGATGYLTAQGGQKIAVFPDTGTGWDALYALWNSKMAAGKSARQALDEWSSHAPGYASSVLRNAGLPGNAMVPSKLAQSSPAWKSALSEKGFWHYHISDMIHDLSHYTKPVSPSNTHTDNSVTNNVGTVNIQGNGQTAAMTPSLARGMDWTTILMQGNYGLTG